MQNPHVRLRFDNVIENYFGEKDVSEELRLQIYIKLRDLTALLKKNKQSEMNIKEFIREVLDIDKEVTQHIIRPNVIRNDTKLIAWSKSKYEGCPIYLPKGLSLDYFKKLLDNNIPLTSDASNTGFTK